MTYERYSVLNEQSKLWWDTLKFTRFYGESQRLTTWNLFLIMYILKNRFLYFLWKVWVLLAGTKLANTRLWVFAFSLILSPARLKSLVWEIAILMLDLANSTNNQNVPYASLKLGEEFQGDRQLLTKKKKKNENSYLTEADRNSRSNTLLRFLSRSRKLIISLRGYFTGPCK